MTESVALERSTTQLPAEMTVDELADQVGKIQLALKRVMKEGTHFGTIPGTNKPTLFKPGAEKLCLLFRLAPDYQVEETWADDGHYSVRATCRLTHSPTGNFVGSGEGLCTTRESRYAMRKQSRVCPICGQEAIVRGKPEYGGGWICFRKKGGCGAKFETGDPVIEDQAEGEIPNDKLADTYNTVLKMACKRALIAGVLNVTAASDIFTQDLEDFQTSAAPVTTSSGAVQPGSQENFDRLVEVLSANADAPEIWSERVVLINANRHFNRKIGALDQLTDAEMGSIIDSALKWRIGNPIQEEEEVVDGEVVYDPDKEE